jgi:hypothetical protein
MPQKPECPKEIKPAPAIIFQLIAIIASVQVLKTISASPGNPKNGIAKTAKARIKPA